jgi:hypothetical protein
MFNLSTQEVVLSIEKSPLLVKEGIYYQHYQNFFGNDILKNLESVENLRTEEFSYSGQHVIPGRQLIDYSETAIKKMKILFSNEKITKSLENKFDTKLKFGSVDVWTDKPGYFMAPHTDDPSIKLAVQIYLGEGQNVGTCLFDNNENILDRFEYKFNCGYALLNNKASLHGLADKVPNNGNLRKSIYARYH